MAFDTPARIAIIGAGPIGLEAALYARFLGYDVDIYEQGRVSEQVRRWGHVQMFSPFRSNSSPLGRAALAAQDPDLGLPSLDALMTGKQYVEQYLLPLAESDLIVDGLHEETEVVCVSRPTSLKTETPGDSSRGDEGFNLLLRRVDGTEFSARCDILLDASGVYDRPLRMGPGGAAAIGEQQDHSRIEYHLPDILGSEQSRFAGRRTLVVGSGYSAATAICQLAHLAATSASPPEADSQSPVTWVTRRMTADRQAGPLTRFAQDPLSARDELARKANGLATDPESPVDFRTGRTVQRIVWLPGEQEADEPRTGQFEVILRRQEDEEQETVVCHNVLALVGYGGRQDFLSELQIQRCYATDGPLKLAAALLGETSGDCLQQTTHGVETLRHPEPNFYMLGSKSYGRNSAFLISTGLEQIKELFALIGDRVDLDLYAGAAHLPS